MQDDRRGTAITTSSTAAVASLDKAVTSFLSHRRDTADHIGAALVNDPELTVAHAFAGFLALLLGRGELMREAASALERAQSSLARRGGTLREQMLVDALGAWCDGEMEQALGRLNEILAAGPLDAMTLKLGQSLGFMLGDTNGMRRSIEAALPAWSDAVQGYGYVLGCHAFALEETGELAVAEATGKAALAREHYDVWGCHAVAHVYETRGAHAEGLAWVATHAERWTEVNNFARHMDWHRALFHLAQGENDGVLELYDRKIRDVRTDDYRDIANAASLLYRLEVRGVGIGQRWSELADLAQCRIHDQTLAFAQLHYLLCLVGDRRWAAAFGLFAAMDLEAKAGHGTQARLLAEIGVPMAKAILANCGADYRTRASSAAAHHLDLVRLGGSHAQRQIFERILRDAEAREKKSGRRLVALLSHAAGTAARPRYQAPRLGAAVLAP